MAEKQRHNPDKPQNNYGGDYQCKQYDTTRAGTEFCHDEGITGWDQFITWCQKDEDGKLKCRGNRYNCNKLRNHWLASLSDEERDEYSSR